MGRIGRAHIVDLARYRAARQRLLDVDTGYVAKAFHTPSPVGFAFLDLPEKDALPDFTRDGFSNTEKRRT